MNYNATSLTEAAAQLQDKISGISPEELQQIISTPSFDSFSQAAQGLLPNNFINTNIINGAQDLLNPTNLTSKLTQGLNQITPEIQAQAIQNLQGLANQAIGNISGLAGSQLSQVTSTLSQMSDAFSTKSAQQMVGALKNISQGGEFGNIQAAMESGFSAVTDLTPKGIKDLNTPEGFKNKLSEAVSNAQASIKEAAQNMASNQAFNPVFSNSGQGAFQQQSSPNFSGDNTNGFQLAVRLTVYWSQGSGTDFWTAAKVSSTGRQLAQGYSAAVDPAVIPYLSRLEIPNVGTRFAVDTGGAVKARKASGGTRPVVDIYFEKRQDALAFASKIPQNTVITVYPPKTRYKYAKNSPPTYGTA